MSQPSPRLVREPMPTPQVRFCATANGVRVAFAVSGRGPAMLVPAAWISHLELVWQDPEARAFFAPLVARRTLVQYDKPGCGLSDPWPGPQSLETDLEVLLAVADHLGLEVFDLFGLSLAAPVSIAFAARHPERVARLILYGGYADGHEVAADDVREAMIGLVRAHWGLGSEVLSDIFLPDASAEAKAHFSRLQRAAAPVDLACELLAQCYETRVDDLLETISVPTLVLHRRGDRAIPYRLGRELATRIPGARLTSLAGRSHFPHAGDSAAVVRAILEFLGHAEAPRTPAAGSGATSAALTARQLQVAALVADGLTNRQIAVHLGIQERSAEGHLERIRQRLGFTSRAQVAAWWATEATEVAE
jgi:pimeloyl-ACP methyl ester carboxylesterase/DNA-binding CsgD family transcriptional regulator